MKIERVIEIFENELKCREQLGDCGPFSDVGCFFDCEVCKYNTGSAELEEAMQTAISVLQEIEE